MGGTERIRGPRMDDDDDRALLTARETEVLELIVNGFSAKKAAQKLGLSPRTIDRHIINVRHKLNARNRAHLVTKAIASGEITLPVMSPDRHRD